MPLRVRCTCGKSLNVPESRAGKDVRCPACQARVAVPKESSEQTAPKPVPAKPQAARPAPRSPSDVKPPTPPPRKKTRPVPAPPPLPSAKLKPVAAKPQAVPTPPPKLTPKSASIAPEETGPVVEEPQEIIRGVEHDPGKKWTVYQLGMYLALIGLLGMYPAIREVVRHYTDFDSRGVESWAYFVFLLSGLQVVYALYLVQLPDWSTVWTVMIVSSIVSVIYAMALGIAMMAGEESALMGGLGLNSLQSAGYVSPWCFMMTLLTSLLTYFLVRAGLKWQRAFDLATAGR